jgi:hypothetical protein
MSEYVWCHGPNCHEYRTQDRVRGSKGSKVLRTRKLKQYIQVTEVCIHIFVVTHCYNEFANKYVEQVIAIAPRREPLETPINVTKEEREGWNGHTYTQTIIREVDNGPE